MFVCSLIVALAEVTCSPSTVMPRLSLWVCPPLEKLHFQVPASEMDTDFRWTEPDPSVCAFPSGLVHCTWVPGSAPWTSQWSVASVPCWRTWEGLAQTEREGMGEQRRNQGHNVTEGRQFNYDCTALSDPTDDLSVSFLMFILNFNVSQYFSIFN